MSNNHNHTGYRHKHIPPPPPPPPLMNSTSPSRHSLPTYQPSLHHANTHNGYFSSPKTTFSAHAARSPHIHHAHTQPFQLQHHDHNHSPAFHAHSPQLRPQRSCHVASSTNNNHFKYRNSSNSSNNSHQSDISNKSAPNGALLPQYQYPHSLPTPVSHGSNVAHRGRVHLKDDTYFSSSTASTTSTTPKIMIPPPPKIDQLNELPLLSPTPLSPQPPLLSLNEMINGILLPPKIQQPSQNGLNNNKHKKKRKSEIDESLNHYLYPIPDNN